MQVKTETDAKGTRWIRLVGGHGDSKGDIRFLAEKRLDLGMALLGLHGEKVKVTITNPPTPKAPKATKKKAKAR